MRTRGGKGVLSERSQSRLAVWYGSEEERRKDEAMIARLDHRPMLTALLALSTTVLLVVVITLATLLFTATPQGETSSGQSGGANPPAVAGTGGEFYGEGWNNYGHDADLPQPAQAGNGADSAVDRHAEVIARHNEGSLR